MAKSPRIRSPYCTNCGKVLHTIDNYCPNCGQENDNKRQSFKKVMAEFFEGLVSIDSRLAHSLPALLFRPGFLTKEFLLGRRQRYLDPIRMFLSILVLYFILASFGNGAETEQRDATISHIIDSVSTANGTDTATVFDNGPFKVNITQGATAATETDTLIATGDEVELDDPDYSSIKKLVKSGITDTRAVMDSLNIENTFWNRFYYSEVIKFASSDYNDFKDFLFSKLPWIIFVLMPVFALWLKLLYFRRDFYYIDHLIFSFHLHSFIFIMGGIYFILKYIADLDLADWLFFTVLIYAILAFKNFYKQSLIKTISKFVLLWGLYLVSALFCFTISLVVIFLIY